MSLLRRLLSVFLILGLVSGTAVQTAQTAMMADVQATAVAAKDSGCMAGCEGCASGQETGKGMDMAGCHNGHCIVLPGLPPYAPGTLSGAPDAFLTLARSAVDGLSLPPEPRPPRSTSLA